PGRVAGEWKVASTHGRRIESPEVAALATEITAELRKEIRRNAA
ncbi:MAG: ABC transporter ATP-binding protein, partial [Actinomycetota bacterium]